MGRTKNWSVDPPIIIPPGRSRVLVNNWLYKQFSVSRQVRKMLCVYAQYVAGLCCELTTEHASAMYLLSYSSD